MAHKATITRRSGRRTKDFEVMLEKPAEEYRTSETLDIEIEGRTVPVHVEIPISEHNERLYVA